MSHVTVDPETGNLIIEGMEADEVADKFGDLIGAPSVPLVCDYRDRFGYGPWQEEADRYQWHYGDTGIVCMSRRAYHGAFCGYVGVPRNHPAWGIDFRLVQEFANPGIHGGLDYSARCDGDQETGICHVPEPGEDDDLWWFGFSCDKEGDLVPLYKDAPGANHYWDHAEVKQECERLAEFFRKEPLANI